MAGIASERREKRRRKVGVGIVRGVEKDSVAAKVVCLTYASLHYGVCCRAASLFTLAHEKQNTRAHEYKHPPALPSSHVEIENIGIKAPFRQHSYPAVERKAAKSVAADSVMQLAALCCCAVISVPIPE